MNLKIKHCIAFIAILLKQIFKGIKPLLKLTIINQKLKLIHDENKCKRKDLYL